MTECGRGWLVNLKSMRWAIRKGGPDCWASDIAFFSKASPDWLRFTQCIGSVYCGMLFVF